MKKLFLSACFIVLSTLALPLYAAKYEQGVHYFTLAEAQPVQTGDKIEVLEMFWYGCPHCFRLEPFLEEWLKDIPENAEYVRLPGILRSSWSFHARVFYAFEALGLVDKLHRNFFDEIHVNNNRMNQLAELTPFLKKHGVNPADFMDAYDSFAVDSKLRHATQMSERYDATGVPTMVVDGKYRTTVSSAGSQSQMMEVINFLVAKAAEERQ